MFLIWLVFIFVINNLFENFEKKKIKNTNILGIRLHRAFIFSNTYISFKFLKVFFIKNKRKPFLEHPSLTCDHSTVRLICFLSQWSLLQCFWIILFHCCCGIWVVFLQFPFIILDICLQLDRIFNCRGVVGCCIGCCWILHGARLWLVVIVYFFVFLVEFLWSLQENWM